ncbi:MAG: DUF2868 domain-containing protein [Rubrivivax sp.]|nr:DUF2868 domain-containing protein [Rubrivivax sp.]
MNEKHARGVILVQAFDDAPGTAWSEDDAHWASRLAAETAPPDATPERLAVERTRHALQRLQARDPEVNRWLMRHGWRWRWVAAAVALGLGLGLTADLLGSRQHIDLLAPTVWFIVAWNLGIYGVLALSSAHAGRPAQGWFRRLLAAWWERGFKGPAVREAAARWAGVSAGLTASRTAAVVHAAAAALALGMVLGMYLRGLVLDYRAGWASTFLEPPTVQAMLGVLLAPATTLTGISLPAVDAVQAMRITPAAPQASAPAADWIHLYAATLLLFVIGPRLLMAAWAFARATARAARIELPLRGGTMFRTSRWGQAGLDALVQVLPYAQTPGAQAALGLRQLLAQHLGEDLVLKMADLTAIGDEEAAAARAGSHGAVLRVALVDLGSTPEDEHHGRFLRALLSAQPPVQTLLLVDEAAFRVRFGSLPGRVAQRREAWMRLGESLGVPAACVNLDWPETAETQAALQQALSAPERWRDRA